MDHQAFLVRQAHTLAWVICVVTYLVMLGLGILEGATDLYAVGRACAATLAVGLLGRLAQMVLARAPGNDFELLAPVRAVEGEPSEPQTAAGT